MACHKTYELFVLIYEVLLMFKLFWVFSLKAIEKPIGSSEVDLTPNDDGEVIRLVIPLLTSERRKVFFLGMAWLFYFDVGGCM